MESLPHQTRFLKTVVAFPGHDDLVRNADSENPGSLGELAVNLEVGVARLEFPGWVIVREDDGGGLVRDHVGEHFTRVDLALVQQTNGNGALFDDLVSAVQSWNSEPNAP
jgi:hypothetical protein